MVWTLPFVRRRASRCIRGPPFQSRVGAVDSSLVRVEVYTGSARVPGGSHWCRICLYSLGFSCVADS